MKLPANAMRHKFSLLVSFNGIDLFKVEIALTQLQTTLCYFSIQMEISHK